MESIRRRICPYCHSRVPPGCDRCLRCGELYRAYEGKPECFTKMANVRSLSRCESCPEFSLCWKISFLNLKKGVKTSIEIVGTGFRYM